MVGITLNRMWKKPWCSPDRDGRFGTKEKKSSLYLQGHIALLLFCSELPFRNMQRAARKGWVTVI